MNRKEFLKRSLFGGALISLSPMESIRAMDLHTSELVKNNNFSKILKEPKRTSGQKTAVGLTAPALSKVKVGFIGIGGRGMGAVYRMTQIEDAEITALCDLQPEQVKRAQAELKKQGRPEAAEYTGEDGWREMIKRMDIDLVYICTPWLLHTPMSVASMTWGKHVACEVPAALTIQECWELVDTSERTRRHFMMLENCCYDFFEMATLNMVQKGLFGEVVHAEGAYIHDLRSGMLHSKGRNSSWRLEYNAIHDGNPYPTHGLGPICQTLNINRGDKMEYLTSMSSKQFGLTAYASEKFGADSEEARREYKKGDMNNTLIRTNLGKTMLIQHDVTSPRPYDRIHKISGTKGYCVKYPLEEIALEPNGHSFLNKEDRERLLKEYEHPLTVSIREKAEKVGGHGGMDFIMDYRLIYCLQRGLPLDQSVYDAASWCSLVQLTELSVINGSQPVKVPDFTRGEWKNTKAFEILF